MKEQLITFETAKLAKEKGWTTNYLNTLDYYKTDGIKAKLEDLTKNRDYKDFYFHAPTQSLLQKWLREQHGIHIEPQLSRNENEEYKDWWFYLYPKLEGGRIKFFPSEIGEGLEFEEALEKGLQEALKLIK